MVRHGAGFSNITPLAICSCVFERRRLPLSHGPTLPRTLFALCFVPGVAAIVDALCAAISAPISFAATRQERAQLLAHGERLVAQLHVLLPQVAEPIVLRAAGLVAHRLRVWRCAAMSAGAFQNVHRPASHLSSQASRCTCDSHARPHQLTPATPQSSCLVPSSALAQLVLIAFSARVRVLATTVRLYPRQHSSHESHHALEAPEKAHSSPSLQAGLSRG